MTTAHDDVFFQVPRTPCKTSAGEVQLPIAYHDTDELIAMFAVEPEPVRAALRDTPLELFTIGGKAHVAIVFFEYRETSIGPYNEVGLATMVLPKGARAPKLGGLDILRDPHKRGIGMYVLKLPVTTAIANAAGRELWGYPKFVTPIDVRLSDKHFVGRVHDPDSAQVDILTLEGALPPPIPMPKVELMLLSVLEHKLLRAVVEVRGKHRGGPGGSLRLSVGSSQHPMAVQLRALGLDGAKPELSIYTRGARSLLHLGTPVAS
jgi:Acetoacetate decarboxylase (ADC)